MWGGGRSRLVALRTKKVWDDDRKVFPKWKFEHKTPLPLESFPACASLADRPPPSLPLHLWCSFSASCPHRLEVWQWHFRSRIFRFVFLCVGPGFPRISNTFCMHVYTAHESGLVLWHSLPWTRAMVGMRLSFPEAPCWRRPTFLYTSLEKWLWEKGYAY